MRTAFLLSPLLVLLMAAPVQGAPPAPTPAEAQAFAERAEAELIRLWTKAERASWVQSTFITEDTELIAADARKEMIARTMELAKESTRFDKVNLAPDVTRKLRILRTSITLPAPSDPAKQQELTEIVAWMEGVYGRGKWCPEGGECLDINAIERVMAESRDPKELLAVWTGWRTISPPMRERFSRYVALANEGARELGYADLGALWRSGYDMPADAFAAEVDRLWTQLKPLYDALHCHVRARLAEKYGADLVKPDQPIPAHLLGNLWAQSWNNIDELVAPPEGEGGVDLDGILKARKIEAQEMVRIGERFFTSLGFEPLPKSFWERSLFTKPRDREVVCHASAWDIDWVDDLRLKMCIQPTAEDFQTVHHELGHNFYQRAYNRQPPLFRDSANDAFHEAIGDTIGLSVTPEYLVKIGFLDKVPPPEADLGQLMQMALEKIAFLPFGKVVDQWRWKVFSGEVTPANYNAAWWDLVRTYQGVAPPVARSENDFDPGAKYHVPANVPYTRYFLAAVLQFQFHKSLCETAGQEGPLHRCSIYANAAAGERLRKALEMGRSRPWPDAMEALTGQREMDARPILDYFAPLKAWLDRQNAGRTCGW